MEELFKKWMEENCSLADSTIDKYSRAINTISNDMIRECVINRSLYSITSFSEFDEIATLILDNPFFLDKDNRGHGMYSHALYYFSKFLRDPLVKINGK